MKNLFFLSLFCFILLNTACDKDDPEIPNEEEVITTLRFTLSPTAGGADVVLQFQDTDGDGGNEPVIQNGTLAKNTSYIGQVEFLNETDADDVEDITEEVAEEADEHQVFYTPSSLNLTVNYTDEDTNANPVGIATSVETGDASNGTLTVVLRHEPNKDAANVASGDITNAGGETDIEVSFNIVIE
ncbi:MAG: hypothetical protein ACPG5B_10685 [Chitinophagales bacterium]